MSFARFLYRNLQGSRFLIVIATAITFVEVGTDILSAFPLKFIIDKVTAPGHPDPHFPGADNLLAFFKQSDRGINGVIMLSVMLIIVLGILNAILTSLQIYLALRIAKSLTRRLSTQLFDHLQCLPVSWHGKQEQGDLVQRMTGNLTDLEKFVADGLVDLVAGILTIVGILIVMLLTNAPFTLISFVIVPALGIVVYIYTSRIKAAAKKEKKADGQVSSVATEAMAKIMEIKAFTLEGFMSRLLTRNVEARFNAGIRAGSLQAQFTPLVDTILAIGTALIVFAGALAATSDQPVSLVGIVEIPEHTVTLGTLTLFLAYLAKLYQPMRDLSKLTALVTGASSAAERIDEVMEQKTEYLKIPEGYRGPTKIRGDISYEKIFFSYTHPGGDPVLNGVELRIPAGQKVALVGLSGSGKTTLANLLPRFYEIPRGWGSLKLDGLDSRDYPITVLRQNISVVLQDSILFDGTIRENIKIGRPDAGDDEMIKAAELACIHTTIMKRSGGYDARIMNQGKNLSGGQRQRIAIARAILRDSPIVILDEPTASLDVEAEAEVMRALNGLAEGRTVLMITHRLTTVGNVDQIIALQNGRIVEQGTYKELKAKGGLFANLLKAQNALELDESGTSSFIRTAALPPDPIFSKAQVMIEIDGRMVAVRQLDKVVLTVGRMPENDIPIPHHPPFTQITQLVSRFHAKVLWKNNRWIIEDAESSNKLRYNGQIVDQHIFSNGDRVHLAPKVALVYRQEGKWAVPPSPSPIVPQLQNAQILVEIESQIVSKHQLDKEIIKVGSLATNDLQIASSYVSRLHAHIVWENGTWVIQDEQGSRNGLHYHGQRITRRALADGDRIYLAPGIALIYQSMQA